MPGGPSCDVRAAELVERDREARELRDRLAACGRPSTSGRRAPRERRGLREHAAVRDAGGARGRLAHDRLRGSPRACGDARNACITALPASSSPENSTPTIARAAAVERDERRGDRALGVGGAEAVEPAVRRSCGCHGSRDQPAFARHGVDVRVDHAARRAPAREHVGAGRAVAARRVADDDLVGAARAEQRREVLAQRALVAGEPSGRAWCVGIATSSARSRRRRSSWHARAQPSVGASRRPRRARCHASCCAICASARASSVLPGLGAMPRRRARRMRQRDHVERRRRARRARCSVPIDLGELVDVGQQLRDRELADRDHEPRPQELRPRRARWRLQRSTSSARRHAIAAAARRLARESSGTPRPCRRARETRPRRGRSARTTGTSSCRRSTRTACRRPFLDAGRLADQHHRRHDRRRRSRRARSCPGTPCSRASASTWRRSWTSADTTRDTMPHRPCDVGTLRSRAHSLGITRIARARAPQAKITLVTTTSSTSR